MKHINFLSKNTANTPQNAWGGYSQQSAAEQRLDCCQTRQRDDNESTTARKRVLTTSEHNRENFVLRSLKYVACILMVLVLSIGQMWGADFDITLDQFRTTPISGLVKIDDSNLSLSGGALQLSSGNKNFIVSTTNSNYKIKEIVFTTSKAVISYGGDPISENTFTPASPGTSFTLNLAASGGTAKITQMVVTLTTSTSETLEALLATAITDGVYTTGSSVITLSTEGGTYNTTSGQEYINLTKSKGTRSLTIATSSSYNIKFIALAFYDAIFSRTITASTGTYTAASYIWTPGATPSNSVTLTFDTGNSEGAKIRRVLVGYESAGGDPEPECGSTSQAALTLSSSSGTVCAGAETTFTVSGGSGTGALSVSSSAPSKATASIDGTTVTVTGVAAGSATITVTKACDATYAEATATYEVTVAAAPTANAGADKTTEPGEGVALAATDAASGCTGAWTIESGPNTATSQLSSTSSATATFTPTVAGTYTLRWTVTNSTSGCSAYDDMTVTAAVCSISECGNATITYAINGGSSGDHATGGTDLISSATASNTTALGASTTVGYTGISMSSLTKKAAAAISACYPTKPNMSGKIEVYNGAAYNSSNYLQFAFTVKTGYTFTPCDIEFTVQPVDVATNFRWEVTDGTIVYGYGTATDVPKGSDGGASVLTGLTSTAEMAADTYYIRLYPYVNAASKTFRISNNVILKGTTAEVTPASGNTITKASATNGTIAVTDGTAAISSAEAGNKVYIAATPNTGYAFDSWSVYKTGDESTVVDLDTDDDADATTLAFDMPAYPVTVGATFTAIDYTITHSAATNGSYTIKVGEVAAVSTSTTANYGQTVVLAAMPASGYKFKAWTVMNGETPVSVSSNQFTMPAGNVTVSAEFEEVECPTSGTLFSLSSVGSGYSNNSGAETKLTNITITGGSAYGYGTSERALSYNSNKIKYAGSANYIKLVLDCPLQAGDVISFTCDDNTGLNFNSSGTSAAGNESYATGALNGSTYTVVADDGLEGAYSIYCWRRTGNGTNVTAITITRLLKYAVTYSSEKGVAPSGASAASVTLAEITGVSGWKNTGWKADVATEVAGETVAANTLIVNGTKVTLKEATNFTAQWAELYMITTGSPANGSVAADKSSAVAGETITLIATPSSGYKLSAWDVYKTVDATTKVTVTNNKFTMPAYGVTISGTFAESVVLYDYSVMAEAGNKSFTDETVGENGETGKSKTFGSEGNPQLIIEDAGWDSKGNIINSFIKFFGGTSSMSVVIPTGRKATVTIQYGSYDANGKYLQVNGTNQAKPVANMSDDMTTETFGNYMRTVELTNQTGTLILTANASGNNLYIAYVDVTLTGYASYGITYHLNDGAWDGDAGAATYTYGTGIATLATNVTKTGYDLAGWYGNEGLTGAAVTSIANNVTGAKELWAKWTPKSYTLTWDWNGGSCSATAGDDYTAGGSVAFGTTLEYPEASTMSKENTAFAGWSTDAATMPAEALTITAQWAPSHAITYTETKGATNSNPELYIEGIGIASFESLADVANFHFTGWSPASISKEAITDQTIVAQWVAAYNVTFSAGEGSGTVPATFQKWATASFELPGQGTMVAPEGKIFDGWKVNGAGENRAAGYEYTMTAAAVEFVAQWKAVTLLINYDGENYSLNTTDFEFNSAKTTLQTANYTVEDVVYPKNVKLGGTATAVTGINADKYIAYHTKTNSTHVEIALYDAYSSNTTHNVYIARVKEGNGTPEIETVAIVTGTKRDYYKSYDLTGRTSLYIYVGNDNARVCQVFVTENGEPNVADAPAVGYSINLNKGRMFAASGVAKSFEGLTYVVAEDYQPTNRTALKIKNLNTHYVSFTIPEGQTRQLQLTTSNTNKYVVSKTLGDDANQITPVAGTAKNFNLTEGTWYINPQGSNVEITNLAFAAAPAAWTVTFKDGSTTLGTQSVWDGETATALSPAPTKSGYRFVKWQLSGADYNFSTAVTANIQLDAVWQETVTVTFAPANGEDNFTKTTDKGAVLAAGDRPAAPVRAGYVFQGWTRNASADPIAYVNLASETFSADATLTAVWEVAQTDATISALSYNGNAINVASVEDVAGVATYTVHLQWGSTIDASLISVTKTASTATVGTIAYDSEAKKATFTVTAGDGTTTVDYAIQFVIDAKRGTSIVKAFVSGGDQKAGFAATGLYGDKGYANTRANKKLDTADKFVGVKLLSGETFEAGDKLYVVTSTDADRGYIEIYEEAAGTNLIKATGVRDASEGITVAELAGHNEFYIVRKESDGDQAWNGIVEYVEVTREMAPVIKSFKFGDDAATINESAKTISIEVPYATDVTALTPTVEAYGNNGVTYTPEGATDFTSPVNYVVTDAYGELSTTYAVTVNVDAPSENANLASLSVAGYALDFNKATTSYNVVLDYGTTVLPEITYAVEDAGLANAEKVEGGVNGATTITVTPQAGAGHEKVYTINFTVSTTPKFVIYDGSTMTTIAESGSDVSTGFAWTMVGGKTDGAKNINVTLNGKTYTTAQNVFTSATKGENAGNTRFIEITIPEGYVAKFYLAGATNDDESIRSSYISKEKTGTLDESIAYASTDSYDGASMRSGYQMPGTYYYCANASIRLYELSVTLYPAHMRNVTVGNMATVCLPNNVEADGIIGAEVYELLYWKYGTSYADCQMVDFGEVTSMEAGHAYLFIPTADKVAFVLGDDVAPAPVVVRGFTGTFTNIEAAYDNILYQKYAIYENHIQKMGHNCWLNANRAYIDLSVVPSKEEYEGGIGGASVARRRISLGNASAQPVTTDLDNLNGTADKVEKRLIDGHLYIIRGTQVYDAEGRLVK